MAQPSERENPIPSRWKSLIGLGDVPMGGSHPVQQGIVAEVFLQPFLFESALLLGVIIAPTTPSACWRFFAANMDEKLATNFESESLFTDGIAVVHYL